MRARPASQETLRFPPKQRPTVSQLQASWEDSQTIRNKNQRTLIVRRAGLSNVHFTDSMYTWECSKASVCIILRTKSMDEESHNPCLTLHIMD